MGQTDGRNRPHQLLSAALAARRRCCLAPRLLSAIYLAQQQTRRTPPLLSINRTDGRTTLDRFIDPLRRQGQIFAGVDVVFFKHVKVAGGFLQIWPSLFIIIIIIWRFLVRLLHYEHMCITAVHRTLKAKKLSATWLPYPAILPVNRLHDRVLCERCLCPPREETCAKVQITVSASENTTYYFAEVVATYLS